MRQAYDYWQNQPGNYLSGARSQVRGAADLQRGRVVNRKGRARHLQPRVAPRDSAPRELPGAAQPAEPTAKAQELLAAAVQQTIQLPPLSSPKDGPPKTRSRPRKDGHKLRYTPLRRRIPSANHALRRLSAWAYPRLSSESDGQRPTIHRLHQSRLAQVQAVFGCL